MTNQPRRIPCFMLGFLSILLATGMLEIFFFVYPMAGAIGINSGNYGWPIPPHGTLAPTSVALVPAVHFPVSMTVTSIPATVAPAEPTIVETQSNPIASPTSGLCEKVGIDQPADLSAIRYGKDIPVLGTVRDVVGFRYYRVQYSPGSNPPEDDEYWRNIGDAKINQTGPQLSNSLLVVWRADSGDYPPTRGFFTLRIVVAFTDKTSGTEQFNRLQRQCWIRIELE